MSRRWLLLLGLASLWGGWHSWTYREVEQHAGTLVATAPVQRSVPSQALPMTVGDFTLRPRAEYDITARLISRRRYWLGTEASLSPLDFAVGWGAMSDSAVLDQLRVSQSNRFFRVRWETPPIPQDELFSSAANIHLIAGGDGVRQVLDRMRPGQVIRLQGVLVDATRTDGWQWNTSLTRDDLGAGACELMWVESAQILSE